jgi:cell division initiation protein
MKYWVYMNGEVPGCYTPQELSALTGFTQTTLVCPAEGEILEKNWRRSGEFPEIIKVLHERQAAKSPTAPSPVEAPAPDINVFIDSASSKLFSHVADLVKELENRREERALTQSLQRQLVDLKEQGQSARERAAMLEARLPRMAELEETSRRDQERIMSLEASVRARDEGLAELRVQLEKARGDLDNVKRRLTESLNDLAIRNRLVDKLSRDLTEKEVSCTKALGVIRRLEEELHRLLPAVAAATAAAAAAPEASLSAVVGAPPPAPIEPAAVPPAEGVYAIPPAPTPSALPEIPALAPTAVEPPLPSVPAPSAPAAEPPRSFTTDEPPAPAPLPAVPPPPDAPQAQQAIVGLFKRFLSSKDLHS